MRSRHAGFKVGDVLKLLQDDGWQLLATRRSHRQFKHVSKTGRVTVAGKPGDDLAPGTYNSWLSSVLTRSLLDTKGETPYQVTLKNQDEDNTRQCRGCGCRSELPEVAPRNDTQRHRQSAERHRKK